MKNYNKEIAFGIALLLIFAGLLFCFISTATQSGLSIIIALLIILVSVVAVVLQIVNKRRDLEAGTPAEDEFTRLAKVYAGSLAFIYSMYLWLLIFVFNSAFTKPETMLGIGILGSALIYGLWLFYFKTTGELYEK